jgi:uncharacterized protein (DUF362 family)
MCVDLLKIILFADRTGKMCQTPQRKLFSVIDGVIGGENKGPLEPDPNRAGLLLASTNFLAADIVGTRLMGFDPMKIRTFTNLMTQSNRDIGVKDYTDIRILTSDSEMRSCLSDKSNTFCNFVPYPGWAGHIEI